MDWAMSLGVGAACLVVGAVFGGLVGFNLEKSTYKALLREQSMRHHADLQAYFRALRKEVANQLIIRDPHKYLNLYRKILWEIDELGKADPARLAAELKIISDTYPLVSDFDIIGGRDYILYTERNNTDEELEKVYRDLHVYATITRSGKSLDVLPAEWSPTTSEKELDHLREYVQELSNTYFRHKIIHSEKALRDFEGFICPLHKVDGFSEIWSKALEATYGGNVKYLTKDFVAEEVFLMPELGNGFTFKDGEAYGLVTFFSGDRDQFYVNIYRSDARFKERDWFKHLNLTHLPVPYSYDNKEALGY